MSSSLSPDQLEGGTSRASTEGADKGVLSSLNLNFFKNLSDKKVTRSKYSRHATNLRLLRRAAADDYSSLNSWKSSQTPWTEARQQARPD